jgi:DNA replication and repair protein RecF
MFLSHLSLQNFRSYPNLDLSFTELGALFFGDNGAGKTNIIEAIHLLSLGRSQRSASRQEMIHTLSNEAYIEGIYTNPENGLQVCVGIGFSKDKKVVLKKDSQRVRTFSELFNQSSVISFGPQDSMLVYADPSERRRFLDIVLCQADGEYCTMLGAYKKDLLNRNTLLSKAPQDSAVDIYEENMALAGSYIVFSRMRFIQAVAQKFSEYFAVIVEQDAGGQVRYKPSIHGDAPQREEIRRVFLAQLRKNRNRDLSLGFTTCGPHRDDIVLSIDSKPAKYFGSQGQCRSLSIALRLCALDFLEQKKPKNSIILIDDAFAELDRKRTVHICSLIQGRGQVFITALTYNNSFFNFLPGYSLVKSSVSPYDDPHMTLSQEISEQG